MKKEKKKVVFDEESKDDVDIDDIDLESFGSKKKKKKKRGGKEYLDMIDRFHIYSQSLLWDSTVQLIRRGPG